MIVPPILEANLTTIDSLLRVDVLPQPFLSYSASSALLLATFWEATSGISDLW